MSEVPSYIMKQAKSGYGVTNAGAVDVDGGMNRHGRMEAEIGVPLYERTYKYAQARMTEEDLKAFRDIVAQHRENARQRELRQANRFARNRRQRVSEAKFAMKTLLGLGGVWAGGLVGGAIPGTDGGKAVGKALGGIGGGIAGLIGGSYAGSRIGNSRADRMEQVERDTGVRVNEQDVQSNSRAARDLAFYDLLTRNR